MPTRSVDIPKIVYYVRRGRASTVKTREQYEFVYKVCYLAFSNFGIFFNILIFIC